MSIGVFFALKCTCTLNRRHITLMIGILFASNYARSASLASNNSNREKRLGIKRQRIQFYETSDVCSGVFPYFGMGWKDGEVGRVQ